MLDAKGKTLVWGANTNGEMGLGDTNPKVVPTYLGSIDDKFVTSVGVGSAFAFALGHKFKTPENYETYVSEEYNNTIVSQGRQTP